MSNGEQVLSAVNKASWLDKVAKSALLSVFERLPQGYMILKERGSLVACFGDKHDPLHAEIDILDQRAYRRLLLGGSIAAGETFTDAWWDSPNLTHVIQLFARNLALLDAWEKRFSWLIAPVRQLKHFQRRNSTRQAKRNIAAHYDLGNRLYTRFLDDSMMYSSAIYPSEEATLAEAQQHKLQVICDKLSLSPDDHLLEIGTGWGGLAIFAAKHYGCRVTTTTISEEQHAWASAWVEREGLGDRITLLKQDYRTLQGQYDKLVSIEMIEAVGKRYLPVFFQHCQQLLKPDGIMLLQSITIDDRRYDSYSKDVDFIQQHIFPGGFLPSLSVLGNLVKQHTSMAIRDVHDIGLDYAKTLDDWHQQLLANQHALAKDGYDERFMRLWRYYFCYCEGGFLERTISTVQLLLTNQQCVSPVARVS
ncbi:cyclopropane-fatty-acyl-phospholipid synthase family protein [Aestuariibacter halophilus]|uniref:Cyclopropane-fatty-acyl-phospholipid synthase family protein n=1 Tax=Fluctibacter halophilus TaxID=226011 RepID=A0ABS8G2J0_9ALTE|nr:cyclopropane-fatty-acyl-phospholipid synthase family protein [Aestuariibacter halophilus]MCC2614743.1 cyclopropane-fatty-acyl-phospholipid synthase family protein [Aestuariibacter halophilus]